eukprot:CAMPEP_0176276764 /NCGR_PEP_ID=MMETSP0121_2-20121125/47928_1 /TAXON_ID=160619 /ORGANISM="Kryptoperidinium foliaceum, Strain CCMP 1326" /LENGTH=95 /DNA_ID=CAMNT_0017617039 /DNA_START=325 /DNA_END=609 /DNA_ORIENTATION=+
MPRLRRMEEDIVAEDAGQLLTSNEAKTLRLVVGLDGARRPPLRERPVRGVRQVRHGELHDGRRCFRARLHDRGDDSDNALLVACSQLVNERLQVG